MKIKYFQYGDGLKKICFVAGIHGIENTGIQIAFELMHFLVNTHLNDQVGILPLVNIEGVLKETRENPVDKEDINSSFINRPPVSSSEKIAQHVWDIAGEYEWIIDLHSAGYASYLPHVIVYEDRVIEDVKYFGFPFIVKRKTGKSGKSGTLLAMAAQKGKKSCALELGGGQTIFADDVNDGMKNIMNFLYHLNLLSGHKKEELIKTDSNQIYLNDCRVITKTTEKGILFFRKRLGDKVQKGDIVAELLDIVDFKTIKLNAPISGKIIYIRTKNNINSGETAFMIL
ncbi:MAG: succinylglutamate desuccinylase/aspartoacylase family protein [Atribacterota bacterium]